MYTVSISPHAELRLQERLSIEQLSLFEESKPTVRSVAVATVPIEPWADNPDVQTCLGVRYSPKPKEGWIHVKHLCKKVYDISAVYEERILDEAWLHPDDIVSIYTNARWALDSAISWGFGPRVNFPGAPQGHAELTFDLYNSRDFAVVDKHVRRNWERYPKRSSIWGCTPDEAADFGGEE